MQGLTFGGLSFLPKTSQKVFYNYTLDICIDIIFVLRRVVFKTEMTRQDQLLSELPEDGGDLS